VAWWSITFETVARKSAAARAAFHIGYGDNTIAGLDARGVDLAAIQGLHRLLQDRDSEIASLRERLSRIGNLLKMRSQPH